MAENSSYFNKAQRFPMLLKMALIAFQQKVRAASKRDFYTRLRSLTWHSIRGTWTTWERCHRSTKITATYYAFTKFVWLFATKYTKAEEIVGKLMLLTNTFENPRRIIADRETAFTAKVFQDHCSEENIELVFITKGVPR